MLQQTTRSSAQHYDSAVGWIGDDSRGGYPELIANPLKQVGSSIRLVTSPKFLLAAAKLLAACMVAVTIMLLLVRGATPTTPTLPDSKVSSVNRALSPPVMAAGGLSCTTTKGTAF